MYIRPDVVKALQDMTDSAELMYKLAMSFLHTGNEHVCNILIRHHNVIQDGCERVVELLDDQSKQEFENTMKQVGATLSALVDKTVSENTHSEIKL